MRHSLAATKHQQPHANARRAPTTSTSTSTSASSSSSSIVALAARRTATTPPTTTSTRSSAKKTVSVPAAPPRQRRRAAPPPSPSTKPSSSSPSSSSSNSKSSSSSKGRFYLNVTGFPFPLGPFLTRKTVRTELDRGSVWLFEQPQGLGLSNVTANVRMTVIKLESTGGLWVHAPIAPTEECIRLLKELDAPVEHVVLPTFAYEHKCFMGPFCRAFPSAKAWVAPRQWSWPVNLPVQFFGIFPAGRLTEEAADPSSESAVPWLAEIEHKPFASSVGIGPYSEVAFYHKKSKTLLVTDAVVQVPLTPPSVVDEGLLLEAGGPLPAAVAAFSAGPPGAPPPPPPPEDPPKRAALGWKRMALQILFFVPGDLGRPEKSFDALAGKMIVSPVLRKLVFGNAKREALEWVDDICASWPGFSRIVPCHFDAPIRAGPRELRAAFSFLEEEEEEEEEEGERSEEGESEAEGEGASTSGRRSGGAESGSGSSSNGSSSNGSGIGGLLGGLFAGVSQVGGGFFSGNSSKNRAVPFDPADMRALDGLSGSLKTTGVLNK